ncbi:uncharacterized protein LOC131640909 [Vicia villosa]|uniref:uncharacterized protein LOC131640909 n=1 Tax=Vicia villosa TaxID=3911 RepID=UPI00273B0133|nr:uncharacterized protein LOC131640909 [Vicia villosa]
MTCVETCNATSIKSAKVLDEEVENKDVEKEDDNRAAEDEEDEIVVTEVNKEVKKRDQSKRKKACDKMASKQAPTAAPAGTFPGQPQPNPKGHDHAIILRSDKEMDEPTDPRLKKPAMFQSPSKTTKEEIGPKDKSSNPKEKEDKDGETKEKEVPYLNITILFTEAITQMPSYAKFLKEILSNKKNIEDNETITLTAECSTIIQNKMPPKLKDPGSFSIPCNIGKFVKGKALCDLGASISLMPLSICEKLNMGELRPTKMSVQLADRSVKYPVSVLENVPVRIGQFYIPTDFIIMDIKEDVNTPIILGRPFLATVGDIIDVKKGKLTFEVGEEKVEFILTQFLQASAIEDTCYLVDVIDECIRDIGLSEESYSDVIKIQCP